MKIRVLIAFLLFLVSMACAVEPDLAVLQKAADAGIASAQYAIGYRYFTGKGLPHEPRKAYEWFQKAAKQGNVASQYSMGYCLEKGEGVVKILNKAHLWYSLAAAEGDQAAKKALEKIQKKMESGEVEYKDSFPITVQKNCLQDLRKSLRFHLVLAKSASNSSLLPVDEKNEELVPGLILDLKLMKLVPKTWYKLRAKPEISGEEILHIEKARKEGGLPVFNFRLSPEATVKFAGFTRTNMGKQLAVVIGDDIQLVWKVSREIKNGRFHLIWSNSGCKNTEIFKLEQLNSEPLGVAICADVAKLTLEKLQRAANSNIASAQVALAERYRIGDGVTRDLETAVAWLKKAASLENDVAQYNIGAGCEKGEGFPKDNFLAYWWYTLAFMNGNEKAAKARNEIAEKLTPRQKEVAEGQMKAIQDFRRSISFHLVIDQATSSEKLSPIDEKSEKLFTEPYGEERPGRVVVNNWYKVQGKADFSEEDIMLVDGNLDSMGQLFFWLQFSQEGVARLADLIEKQNGKTMAIVLNGRVRCVFPITPQIGSGKFFLYGRKLQDDFPEMKFLFSLHNSPSELSIWEKNETGQSSSGSGTFPISSASTTNEINLGDGVKMAFTEIPHGFFMMGEKTVVEVPCPVKISKAFFMSTYEVTQAQFQKVMGMNPSFFSPGESGTYECYSNTDDLPVEKVSWFDCIRFCNSLSTNQKLQPCYSNQSNSITIGDDDQVTCNWNATGFRLPTEAEWEYACRANSTGTFNWGDDSSEAMISQFAWFDSNTSRFSKAPSRAPVEGQQPVGRKLPNSFGLFDMSGNVSEWVWDSHNYMLFKRMKKPPLPVLTDPRIDFPNDMRSVRGGGWWGKKEELRSAYSSFAGPMQPGWDIGFRIVFVPESSQNDDLPQVASKQQAASSIEKPMEIKEAKPGDTFFACDKEWMIGERNINWNEGQTWIISLGNGWRAPTKAELGDLYRKVIRNSPIQADSVWAEANEPSTAWYFTFFSGKADEKLRYTAKTVLRAVAVRSRKP